MEDIINDYCFDGLYLKIHDSIYSQQFTLLNDYLSQHRFTGTIYRKSIYHPHKYLKTGDIINYDHRISSWSKDLAVCQKFVPDGCLDDDDDLTSYPIFKVDCEKVAGKDISDINKHEQEVLLASGIKLKVANIDNNIYSLSII